jgi:hypothetical protein
MLKKQKAIQSYFGSQTKARKRPREDDSPPEASKKSRTDNQQPSSSTAFDQQSSSTSDQQPSTSTTRNSSKATSKTKTKPTTKRGFSQKWLAEFPWVTFNDDKELMFCKVCRLYPNIANTSSTLYTGAGAGKTGFRRETLNWHNTSTEHLKCMTRKANDDSPENVPLRKINTKLTAEKHQQMEVLFKTAFYVAKEKDAFNKFSSRLEYAKSLGVDTGTMYHNDKSCKVFIESIASIKEQSIVEAAANARFLTVLADGSTDCSVTEQESVFIRFVTDDGTPSTRLAALVPAKSASADGVFRTILEGLDSIGVNESVIKQKVVSCNFDGAPVMLGCNNGVGAKMQDLVGRDIVNIHCVAHNLELGACDAAKSLDYLQTFNDTVHSVYRFYSNSGKKRRELHAICSLLEEDDAFFTSLRTTRWVASQHRALVALEKHYVATVTHFEHAASDGCSKAAEVLVELKSVKFVQFLHFLIDIMDILGCLSQQFQADKLFLTDVVVKLDVAHMRLEEVKLLQGKKYLQFLKNFDPKSSSLKCGKEQYYSVTLTGDQPDLDKTFGKLVDKFNKYIAKRFATLRKPPMSHFNVFDQRNLPTDRKDIVLYGKSEIQSLLDFFSDLLTEEELDAAPDQWMELKSLMNTHRHLNTMDFYAFLLKAPPVDLKDILPLVRIMVTLSPTTAKLERSFSAMKAIKSFQRSRLDRDSLQMLMRVSDSDLQMSTYNPGPAIDHWLGNGQRSRHIVNFVETVPSPSPSNVKFVETVPSIPPSDSTLVDKFFGEEVTIVTAL